ncbi:MAG: hypothetical protein AAF585_26085 [Verrucomicrobiota bacterium]
MKASFITPIVALCLGFASSLAAEESLVFELESLKFVHTLELLIDGEKVSGSLNSTEYGDGENETVTFEGKKDGALLVVKFDRRPPLISITKPDADGRHVLKLGKEDGKDALFIPIYGRYDEETKNHPIYEMPLYQIEE